MPNRREELKRLIDRLSDENLDLVYDYILNLNPAKKGNALKNWKTRNFEGAFDTVDIRKLSYR